MSYISELVKMTQAEAAEEIKKAKAEVKMSREDFVNTTIKEYSLLISASPGLLTNEDNYIFIEGSKGKKLYKQTGKKITDIYDSYIKEASINGINYWTSNITLWGEFLSTYQSVIKNAEMTNYYFNPKFVHNFYHLLALYEKGMVKKMGDLHIQLGKCFFASRLVIIRNTDLDIYCIARIVYSEQLPSEYGNKSFLMSSPTNAKALGTLKPEDARYPVEVEFLSAYFLYNGGIIKSNVNKKIGSIAKEDIITGLFSPEVFDGYGTLSKFGASVMNKNIKPYPYLGACCSKKEIKSSLKEKKKMGKYTLTPENLDNQSYQNPPDKKAKGSKKKE